jgi:hypothetical protein
MVKKHRGKPEDQIKVQPMLHLSLANAVENSLRLVSDLQATKSVHGGEQNQSAPQNWKAQERQNSSN